MRLNNKLLKSLQIANLLVFCISVGMIILMHSLPTELLTVLRVPTFLKDIDPLLGFVWPASLLVYQVTLLFFFLCSVCKRYWSIFLQISYLEISF